MIAIMDLGLKNTGTVLTRIDFINNMLRLALKNTRITELLDLD